MNIWDLGSIQQNDSQVYLVPTFDAGFIIKSVANRDHNGAMVYNLLKEGLVYSIDTYAVKKNFAFKRRISSIVQRIREGRLLEWYNTISFYEARQLKLLRKEQKGGVENVKVVTFNSLSPAFTLLIVGYVLSILVFICEVCCCPVRARKMKLPKGKCQHWQNKKMKSVPKKDNTKINMPL